MLAEGVAICWGAITLCTTAVGAGGGTVVSTGAIGAVAMVGSGRVTTRGRASILHCVFRTGTASMFDLHRLQ